MEGIDAQQISRLKARTDVGHVACAQLVGRGHVLYGRGRASKVTCVTRVRQESWACPEWSWALAAASKSRARLRVGMVSRHGGKAEVALPTTEDRSSQPHTHACCVGSNL